MSRPAPTLNKAAGPDREQGPARPVTPAEREQDERKRAQRERVAIAVEFGAALEGLVAYAYQVAYARLQRDELHVAPRISGPRFPPDLLVRVTPKPTSSAPAKNSSSWSRCF